MAETAAPYTTGGVLTSSLDEIDEAISRLQAVDLESADEPCIRDGIARMQRQTRQLAAAVAAAADQLTRRQAARINPADPDDRKARQQAERDTHNELVNVLHITHGEAKDAVAAGGALEGLSGATRQAFTSGEITAKHARILDKTLADLVGLVDADATEARLLDAARTQNVTEFAKTCQELVARTDPAQAQRDLDRARRRRYGYVTEDESGMVHIRAGLVGIEAEIARTAIEVFRDKDHPDDLRRTEQRTADAIFNALNHALRHANKTDHGNRPHILVHVQADQLAQPEVGVAETTFAGTLPLTELAPLMDDAVFTRVVFDPQGQVIDVGRATRNVTAATWRGLVARDRGCTLCSAPPQRCQAAHLDGRWVQGAGTSIHEQGLLCWPCHRKVDRKKLIGKLTGTTITWHNLDGTPYHPHTRKPH